jgi:hypothetical protein
MKSAKETAEIIGLFAVVLDLVFVGLVRSERDGQ